MFADTMVVTNSNTLWDMSRAFLSGNLLLMSMYQIQLSARWDGLKSDLKCLGTVSFLQMFFRTLLLTAKLNAETCVFTFQVALLSSMVQIPEKTNILEFKMEDVRLVTLKPQLYPG